MSEPGGGWSAGEIAGLFAGIVTLLGTIGAGIGWLITWRDRQRDNFYQKNLAWEERLKQREDKFEADQAQLIVELQARASRTELQMEAVLNGYRLIAARLRQLAPSDHVLVMAEDLLRAAFRLDPVAPAEMSQRLQEAAAAVEAAGGDKSH